MNVNFFALLSFRKDTDRADLIPSTIANVKWPQIVIKFYEDRVTWTQNNENGESWGILLLTFYLVSLIKVYKTSWPGIVDYSDLVDLTTTDCLSCIIWFFLLLLNKKKAMFGILYILKVCKGSFYLNLLKIDQTGLISTLIVLFTYMFTYIKFTQF